MSLHNAEFRRPSKRIIVCGPLLCSLLWVAIFSAGAVGQSPAHRHTKLGPVTDEVLPDVEITPVVLDRNTVKGNRAQSPNGQYEAFTSSHDDQSTSFRIYFREKRTGKVYEVRGLPLPHRPFSDLAWISNSTLVFDRWSQPHYGIHYVVNVKAKKLLSASAFPD